MGDHVTLILLTHAFRFEFFFSNSRYYGLIYCNSLIPSDVTKYKFFGLENFK